MFVAESFIYTILYALCMQEYNLKYL